MGRLTAEEAAKSVQTSQCISENPENMREIMADENLQPIFGGKKLDMFQMTKAVNKHLKLVRLVTMPKNHFAEVREGCVCRDRNSLCCRPSPTGLTLL
jgi:hypothetical protein